jgi:hypothetical protein
MRLSAIWRRSVKDSRAILKNRCNWHLSTADSSSDTLHASSRKRTCLELNISQSRLRNLHHSGSPERVCVAEKARVTWFDHSGFTTTDSRSVFRPLICSRDGRHIGRLHLAQAHLCLRLRQIVCPGERCDSAQVVCIPDMLEGKQRMINCAIRRER